MQWLVQRFRSERLRVRSRRSATFTPSAHVRRQSLPVWPPTLNNYLYLFFFLPWRRKNVAKGHLAPSNLTFLLIAINTNGFCRMKEEGQIYKTLLRFF